MITDKMVEAACEVMFPKSGSRENVTWAHAKHDYPNTAKAFASDMRAALEAAERARAEDWEAYATWSATNTYSPAPDAK